MLHACIENESSSCLRSILQYMYGNNKLPNGIDRKVPINTLKCNMIIDFIAYMQYMAHAAATVIVHPFAKSAKSHIKSHSASVPHASLATL